MSSAINSTTGNYCRAGNLIFVCSEGTVAVLSILSYSAVAEGVVTPSYISLWCFILKGYVFILCTLFIFAACLVEIALTEIISEDLSSVKEIMGMYVVKQKPYTEKWRGTPNSMKIAVLSFPACSRCLSQKQSM